MQQITKDKNEKSYNNNNNGENREILKKGPQIRIDIHKYYI